MFDPDLDGGAWPGPVGAVAAAAGEAWLGSLGLLGRLELELGLGGAWPSRAARVCHLAAILAASTDRGAWWQASFEADQTGTCRRLLRDRDTLALWGWRGQPVGPRLDELWRATAPALPGIADRLASVTAALASRTIDVATVQVMSPLSSLAPAWRELFAALVAQRVAVEQVALPSESAPGDLGAARAAIAPSAAPRFRPTGDGRLTLLRAHGSLAAADEVAVSLAALPSLDGVLVIGGDAVLDAALARHGLPRLGGVIAAPASVAIVRLALEAAFEPMDPSDLHALLCLDPGPIPRGVATALAAVLARFPGRASPVWRDALASAIASLDDARRPAVAARLDTLLSPATPRDGRAAVSDLSRRLQAVATWARGRVGDQPSLSAAIAVADSLRHLLAARGAGAVTRLELRRLCDELAGGGAVAGGQAGLASVRVPGAVLGPARVIVWWGFTRDRARGPARVRLSQAERTALAAAGVPPPDLGGQMETEASRWRRPLDMATEALVLVCPMTAPTGEPSFPHPLWDELSAAMEDPQQARLLEARTLRFPAEGRRETVAARALPSAALRAAVAVPIQLRERESPSSLERLLGCSLQWALHYRGSLRAGLSAGPAAPSPLLDGNLAHHLLARVFEAGALPAADAAARAEAILDRDLDGLCETLALPRYQVERGALRHAVIETARGLGALLTTTGATVRGVELPGERAFPGVNVAGTADLVLSDPDVVIDLKWGRTTNRAHMANGTALQLAAYAELFATDERRPAIAYFIIRTQELFGEPGSTLPDVASPGQARADDIWRGALSAIAIRTAELERGELHAPGATSEAIESGLVDGHLALEPGCRYCELSAMCGRGGCP